METETRKGYDKDGNLILETVLLNRRKLQETEYFPDGKIARKSTHVPLGVHAEEEREEFYQNGHRKLWWRRIFEDKVRPVKLQYKTYFDNGQLREEATSLNWNTPPGGGPFDGERRFYLPDGELNAEEHYLDGKPTGIWRALLIIEGEKHIVEDNYEDKFLSRRTIKHKTTGAVISTEEYYPDGSRKNP